MNDTAAESSTPATVATSAAERTRSDGKAPENATALSAASSSTPPTGHAEHHTDKHKDAAGKPHKGGGKNSGKKASARARGPHPVLEKLFELYPQLFGARFMPLKLGVFQDLMARHPEAFAKEELKVAMGLHARSTRYLEAVAAGHPRHDLDGQAVEPVAPEHVHHAIMELHRRRQLRTPDDLSSELRLRLVRAIDESGLSHEAYAERTRTKDEAHNAVLDAALAEHASTVARREALLRAFEASGKSEAEFADMYGMDPKEVGRTLQRARATTAPAASSAASDTSVLPGVSGAAGATAAPPAAE